MRILTWNLWWRFGPWEQRRKAILAVLREERPDVVGLQEVWELGGENLAGWLAEELGMHWAWAPGELLPHWRERLGDVPGGVGNAVLSRWPIVETAVERLPVAGGPPEVRTALYALVDAAGGARVPFFTTHLHSASGGSAVRCEQVRALARFVAARRGPGPFPPVVTGDFNALPESDEVRLFGGMVTAPAVPGQVMLDAWYRAEPGATPYTWDGANPYLEGLAWFDARIDYVHVGVPGPGGEGRVLSARRAGAGPVEGYWGSDHTAVVAGLAGARASA
ncbi:endonuclease/exonuclease/phosphatase family protein [Streptomyces sp. 4N509B]|uniref:endonuclease/exonuclease/phosphatase family protein n=1 Tax=Streptomyces sp. 4N509B TaxID=3457413 RepID=UPI003FD10B69